MVDITMTTLLQRVGVEEESVGYRGCHRAPGETLHLLSTVVLCIGLCLVWIAVIGAGAIGVYLCLREWMS